jgi:succinoglycan biosynthesis transport protein ExoP
MSQTTAQDGAASMRGESGALASSGRPLSRPASGLRASWALVYRNRLAVVLIIAAALLVGLAAILFMPRTYQAVATVQIEPPSGLNGAKGEDASLRGSDVDRYLQTQVNVLTSRTLAERVATRLALASSDDFLSAMATSAPDAANSAARDEGVLRALQENVSAQVWPNSQVVGIGFSSRDPELAARVVNAYSDEYIASNFERAIAAGSASRGLLQAQLGEAKERLAASERALMSYVRAARLIDAGDHAAGGTRLDPGRPATAELARMNGALVDAKVARLHAEQRWQQAQSAAATTLGEALENPAMQQLLQQQAELRGEIGEMRQHMRADHPTLQRTAARLGEIEQEVRSLGENIRKSIRDQYLATQGQEQALGEQVDALRSTILSRQSPDMRYDSLRREVDGNRQVYDGLLQRSSQLGEPTRTATSNVSIIDAAEAPRHPVFPRPLLTMVLALVAGIGLALLYAFGREKVDDTILDPADAETKLSLPLLGVVPEILGESLQDAVHSPGSALLQAYDIVRSSIELSPNHSLPSSLLITSSAEGEGKSLTAYVLARDLAQRGRKVLLIDADLHRPSLHELVGTSPEAPGLTSVLGKIVPFEQVIVPGEQGAPDFLPSGPQTPNAGPLVSSAGLAQLLQSLTAHYEFVVLDGPPVTAWSDASGLAAAASATVFVVEAGAAHFGQARSAVARLRRVRGNVLGCVVTKYNPRKVGHPGGADYYGVRVASLG